MIRSFFVRPDAATNDTRQSWTAAVRASLIGPGTMSASICTALPTIVYAVVATMSSLAFATLSAAVAAVGAFVYRVGVKQPLRPAAIGLAIAGACAATAAATGDVRGFFLAPTVITILIIVVCLASVVARRPLAGLLLNRLAGGPPRWYLEDDLLRLYTRCTYVCIVVNVASTIAQIVGYVYDATWLLAALHIANPVVFTAIIAVTVVAARSARTRKGERHMPTDTMCIDPATDVTTVISIFTTTPERQTELLEVLTNNADRWLRHLDGFISASLHPSLDGSTIVNYAQWRDPAALAAMLNDPEARRHQAHVARLGTVTPIRCTIHSVHRNRTEPSPLTGA